MKKIKIKIEMNKWKKIIKCKSEKTELNEWKNK